MTMAAKQKAIFTDGCGAIATCILPAPNKRYVPKDNSQVRFAEQITSIVRAARYGDIG